MPYKNDLDATKRELILDELARISNSELFRNSIQARKFLSYVVHETIDGRASRIKSYSIGLEVFGRPSSFDASHDPIVRTAANRLRATLDKYYSDFGQYSPVIISLPKGRYVPAFDFQKLNAVEPLPPVKVPMQQAIIFEPRIEKTHESPWLLISLAVGLAALSLIWLNYTPKPHQGKTTIIVQPVSAVNQNPEAVTLAGATADQLVNKLKNYGSVDVVDASDFQAASNLIESQKKKAAIEDDLFSLTTAYQEHNEILSVSWRLIDLRSQKVAWAAQENISQTASNKADDIANTITSKLLGTEGVVPVLLDRLYGNTNDARQCLSRSQRQALFYDDNLQVDIQRCLEDVVRTQPEDSESWALLSLTYYNSGRTAASLGNDPSVYDQKQHATADRARDIAPTSFLTLQALMFAAYADGQFDMFDEIRRKLLDQFGGDPHLKIRIGHALAAIGRFDEALPLVKTGIDGSQTTVGIGFLVQSYYAYSKHNYEEALNLIQRVGTDDYYMIPLMKAAILAQLGQTEKSHEAKALLLKLRPGYEKNFYFDFLHKKVAPEYFEPIADGLRKAGLDIIPMKPSLTVMP